MDSSLRRLLSGAAAGALATLPMSAVMLAWHRQLPWLKRDPLPPAQITKQFTKFVGIHDELEHEGRLAATVASHFGYGASVGAIYGLAAEPRSATQAAVSGMAFGMGVWAASYAGWLPAAGLYKSAAREPRERHAMMIAAHLVFGAGLGVFSHAIRGRLHKQRSRRAPEGLRRPEVATSEAPR